MKKIESTSDKMFEVENDNGLSAALDIQKESAEVINLMKWKNEKGVPEKKELTSSTSGKFGEIIDLQKRKIRNIINDDSKSSLMNSSIKNLRLFPVKDLLTKNSAPLVEFEAANKFIDILIKYPYESFDYPNIESIPEEIFSAIAKVFFELWPNNYGKFLDGKLILVMCHLLDKRPDKNALFDELHFNAHFKKVKKLDTKAI